MRGVHKYETITFILTEKTSVKTIFILLSVSIIMLLVFVVVVIVYIFFILTRKFLYKLEQTLNLAL